MKTYKGKTMFKIVNDGKLPIRGSKYPACVDVYSNEDVVIGAGETKLVKLGIAIDEDGLNRATTTNELTPRDAIEAHRNWFMSTHYLQLMLRSSLGKAGLIMPSGVGVIDLDFSGEICMIIHNPICDVIVEYGHTDLEREARQTDIRGREYYEINKGDRIGQITLLEHKSYLFGIDTDNEREGGFGSTGKC
jgi:dUTPase